MRTAHVEQGKERPRSPPDRSLARLLAGFEAGEGGKALRSSSSRMGDASVGRRDDSVSRRRRWKRRRRRSLSLSCAYVDDIALFA